MSQQLKGNIEIVENSEVLDLFGSVNETEIILNGKKVNSLLRRSDQEVECNEEVRRRIEETI